MNTKQTEERKVEEKSNREIKTHKEVRKESKSQKLDIDTGIISGYPSTWVFRCENILKGI